MKKQFLFLLGAFFFISSFLVSSDVLALTLSPAKLEVQGDAGSNLVGELTVYNEKDTNQTFYISFENFEPSGDSGRPRFVGSTDGLATWMSADSSVTLKPKQRKKVPFSIAVPADADAGGYFSAVFFGTEAPNQEAGKVSIGGRLGTLLLMRVNGDIPEIGGLLDYDTVDSRYFYDIPPVSLEYRFSNDGGDYVTPKGEVKIKNTFGSLRDQFDANPQEGSVLPGSARKFKSTWSVQDSVELGFFKKAKAQLKDFHFGFYKAEINVAWGYTNQVAHDSLSFLIIPWQLIIVTLIFLAILYFILKFGAAAYKRKLLKELRKEDK